MFRNSYSFFITNEKQENNKVANHDMQAKICVKIGILVQLELIQA